MRTTPFSVAAPSADFANRSSWPTEPTEYAPMPIDTVPLDCCSSNDVPVSSVPAPVSAAPRPVRNVVGPLPVVMGIVRVLNLNEDQRCPSPSPSEVLERRRNEAVATTGRFATVRDMQSSTSAEMITGMPPLLIMYAAWTRDTIVVTTGEKREKKIRSPDGREGEKKNVLTGGGEDEEEAPA